MAGRLPERLRGVRRRHISLHPDGSHLLRREFSNLLLLLLDGRRPVDHRVHKHHRRHKHHGSRAGSRSLATGSLRPAREVGRHHNSPRRSRDGSRLLANNLLPDGTRRKALHNHLRAGNPATNNLLPINLLPAGSHQVSSLLAPGNPADNNLRPDGNREGNNLQLADNNLHLDGNHLQGDTNLQLQREANRLRDGNLAANNLRRGGSRRRHQEVGNRPVSNDRQSAPASDSDR